ncbi:MAG: sulfatase-like hydrolase/transferase [Acidobacteriota bacterium]|nr:sulfatase-like hydrolase/transferase [Acidobacteriota bacterium]
MQMEISRCEVLRLAIFLAFYGIVANTPYWFASVFFHFMPLGMFSLQYLTAGALSLVLPTSLSVVLLVFLVAEDVVFGICRTYYLPVWECFSSLAVVESFSLRRIVAILASALLLAGLACGVALLRIDALRLQRRGIALAGLLLLAAVGAALDVERHYHMTGNWPSLVESHESIPALNLRQKLSPRMVRLPVSGVYSLLREDLQQRQLVERSGLHVTAMASATAIGLDAATELSATLRPNFVLVLVESWGQAKNPALRSALTSWYLAPEIKAHYTVTQGTVPFRGPTVAGEARELCGSSFGFHLLKASAAELTQCVPAQLRAEGYHTFAVHGMSGNLFDRSRWYPRAAFEHTWFRQQLQEAGLHDCIGALIGTCDNEVAHWLQGQLHTDDGHPLFAYWLTLNSHLPMMVPASLADGADCTLVAGLRANSPLCSWYQLESRVHASVVQLALSHPARPTVIVVVGDHAPPFDGAAERSQFLQTEVPFVILVPRSTERVQIPELTASQVLPQTHGSRRTDAQRKSLSN